MSGWLVLSLVGLVVASVPSARAQDEAAPPASAASREVALEERLRKMEEMNQRLLQQFGTMARQNEALTRTVQDVSKQNEALTRTVQDVSKKLDDATRGQKPGRTGSVPDAGDGGSGAGAGAGAAGETNSSTISGGLSSPSSPGDQSPGAARPLVPLKAFLDPNYQQRYGFVFRTVDKEFELRLNGLVQVDARIYGQRDQVPVVSDIDIPRTRMWFSGRLTKPIEYQISFQRSTNNFDILNAFLNFHYDDRLQFRAGRFRAPFTYEWAKLSIWELPTPERSPFAINFGPNRQVGLMGWGNVLENRLEYAVGVFDGPRNSYQDFNYAKDVMAFLDYRPFYAGDSPLKALSVGGSVDAGRQDNPLSPGLLRGSVTASGNTLATASGDSIVAVPFLAFNNNVREKGDRALWELHATYFYKGFGLLAAWDSGHNDFSLTTRGARPVHLPVSGSFIQATYLVTGETREKLVLVEPLHPFNLRRGSFGLGALELQARYSNIAVGPEVFNAGLADPNLWTNRADFVDAGFNWYLTRYVKYMFDWQHAVFGEPVYYRPGPGLQKTSDLFWMRLQCYF